jgi:hypothetical protein
MLIDVVRHRASPNEIIVNEAQGGRKPFLFMDQPTITFGLNPIVAPALLPERCPLHQRSNFAMKQGKVRPADKESKSPCSSACGAGRRLFLALTR